ncbi:MAG: energy transducer TonB [Firmicutes bacterium]|nr:energy transducer TonB [Bacillota bacterium]
MLRPSYGFIIAPPRKTIKWNSLCNMFLVVLILHAGLLILFGKFIPGSQPDKLALFDVALVKDVKLGDDKTVKTEKVENDNKGKYNYYSRRTDPGKPGPKRNNDLPPGPKKPNPPSDAKPPVGDNAAPNVPLKMDMHKSNYPTYDQNSNNVAYKTLDNAHKDGAPSGQPDGILGSKGTDGDVFGIGGGDGNKAGGGGGGGGGGGMSNDYALPHLMWDADINVGSGASEEEIRNSYFKSYDTTVYLSDPSGTKDERKMMGLSGWVSFQITIKGTNEVPYRGVHPSGVYVIDSHSENKNDVERLKTVAYEIATNSGWYPAKKSGKPIDSTFKLTIRFTGEWKKGLNR